MTVSNTSFPKSERLRRTSEFRAILKNARSIRGNKAILYFSGKKLQQKSRLGVVISRRVFKLATDRNRAKRVVREFFRSRKANFRGHFDLVVRFIDGSNLFKNNNLEQILTRLFEEANILPPRNQNALK